MEKWTDQACVLINFWLSVTPWTAAQQDPLSMEFSRQEYRRELPLPFPGDIPDSGIKPVSFVSPALAGRFFTSEPPGKSGLLKPPVKPSLLRGKKS